MPRPKLPIEEKKRRIKEKNANYYLKNIERITERNNVAAKEYYYNNKQEINKKAAKRAKDTRAELKRLKAILAEQAETDTEKLFLPAQ